MREHALNGEVPILGIGRPRRSIDRQNGGRCGERQVRERGRLAAPGVGDIETGARDLDGLRPREGADRRLKRPPTPFVKES